MNRVKKAVETYFARLYSASKFSGLDSKNGLPSRFSSSSARRTYTGIKKTLETSDGDVLGTVRGGGLWEKTGRKRPSSRRNEKECSAAQRGEHTDEKAVNLFGGKCRRIHHILDAVFALPELFNVLVPKRNLKFNVHQNVVCGCR